MAGWAGLKHMASSPGTTRPVPVSQNDDTPHPYTPLLVSLCIGFLPPVPNPPRTTAPSAKPRPPFSHPQPTSSTYHPVFPIPPRSATACRCPWAPPERPPPPACLPCARRLYSPWPCCTACWTTRVPYPTAQRRRDRCGVGVGLDGCRCEAGTLDGCALVQCSCGTGWVLTRDWMGGAGVQGAGVRCWCGLDEW